MYNNLTKRVIKHVLLDSQHDFHSFYEHNGIPISRSKLNCIELQMTDDRLIAKLTYYMQSMRYIPKILYHFIKDMFI